MSGADTSYVKGGGSVATLYSPLSLGNFVVADGAGGTQPATDVPEWVRQKIGVDAAAVQPASLAAQAIGDTRRRRGPVALVGTAITGIRNTVNTADSTPSIMLGTSGVITYYNASAGGGGGGQMVYAGSWNVSGWAIENGANTVVLAFLKAAIQRVTLSTPSAGIGWHSVAWTVMADGLSVRYSFDGIGGGAGVTTGTLTSSPLAPVARDVASPIYLGTNATSVGISPDGISYLALWESELYDADLAILAANASAGAPDVTAIGGGLPTWEWAASAFVGVESVTIDGRAYTRLGTPTIWMP